MAQQRTNQPGALAATVAARLAEDDHTLGVAVTGSHARGDGHAYSDIDVLRYVRDGVVILRDYTLHYESDVLVSVTTRTLTTERERMGAPQSAVHTVPGLRQMHILYDPQGALADLQAAANAFTWDADMQARADEWAAEQCVGFVEEAHKLLHGLAVGDESPVYIALIGMLTGLPHLVAVQRGVLIASENDYLRQMSDAGVTSPEWAAVFRQAAGASQPPLTLLERGRAALALFYQTVSLLRRIFSDEQFRTLSRTLRLIQDAGYTGGADVPVR